MPFAHSCESHVSCPVQAGVHAITLTPALKEFSLGAPFLEQPIKGLRQLRNVNSTSDDKCTRNILCMGCAKHIHSARSTSYHFSRARKQSLGQFDGVP